MLVRRHAVALCVVATQARVVRESIERGAVVCRLAPTWIRFGNFEHQRAFSDTPDDDVRLLLDYTIRHHFRHLLCARDGSPSDTRSDLSDPADPRTGFNVDVYEAFFKYVGAAMLRLFRVLLLVLRLLRLSISSPATAAIVLVTDRIALRSEVVRHTADMVAAWQAVGFVHGVMNTDNMSILGLTLDFGPFAFLDVYDPEAVFNCGDDAGVFRFKHQARPGPRCYTRARTATTPLTDHRSPT